MKVKSLVLLGAIAGLCAFTNLSAQTFAGWTLKKQVFINTQTAGVTGDNTDFPLLVRLNSSNFVFTEAQGNGEDIRFGLNDSTGLEYEIERWDLLGEVAEIWVKVPGILGSNATQFIWMYWGNPGATSTSNGAGVFDAGNHYAAVWHLENTSESTIGSNSGPNNGADIVPAIAGRGFDFESSESDNFDVGPNNAGAAETEVSISLWLNLESFPRWGVILNADGWSPGFMHYQFNDSLLQFSINGLGDVTYSAILNTSQWYHITTSWNKTANEIKWYIDGTLQETDILSVAVDCNLSVPYAIGAWFSGGFSRFLDGQMDELKISTTTRTADWVKLSYENQKSGSAVVTFGSSEAVTVPPILGIDQDHVIPASRVSQSLDGTGTVTIQFRVKDPAEENVGLEFIHYNTGSGWVNIPFDSPAFEPDWWFFNWSSKADFTGTIHSFSFITSEIPALAGEYFPSVQFRLNADNNIIGEFATTGAIPLDNKFPVVTINSQTTPERSPLISGTSDELLSQAQVTVDGALYVASIVDNTTFEIPAGVVPTLVNGTYTVSVTATDVFGNVSNQNFPDVLTINGSAPGITVDLLNTNIISPAITGTVTENGAAVSVTIGSETYSAVVAAGVWTVAAGTFLNLSEGTHNVTATASYGGFDGVDGTGDELVIDVTLPIATTQDLYTNVQNPVIAGNINEPGSTVSVTIDSITVQATVVNFDWTVEGNPFEGIDEGSYPITLEATDRAGNVGTSDSSVLVIDRTTPTLESVVPDRIKTTRLPELRMNFNEPVQPGTGTVNVLLAADNSLHQIIPASTATGGGTNTLTFSLEDSLVANSDYYVLVVADAVTDLAGNSHPGISADTSWIFSAAGADDTFIKLVTSTDTSGIYSLDKVISLTINFSDSVVLTGGNLMVTLETGVVDTTIMVAPFSATDAVTFTYTVRFGDLTGALDIISLELDSGAVLQTLEGGDVILDIGQDQNLSNTKIIGLDGIQLTLDVSKPRADSIEDNAAISYTISKNIASGTVFWKMVSEGPDGMRDDLKNITLPFTPAMLTTGTHSEQNLNPLITRGERYDITLTVIDSAGTSLPVEIKNVQIGQPISSITISPGETTYQLNELVSFSALDANSNTTVSEGVSWTLVGVGELSSQGNYTANGIGPAKIIVHLGDITDTLNITVNSGVISILGNSTEVISAAQNLHLQFTVPLNENTILSFSSVADTLVKTFDLVGPGIVFESFHVGSTVISLKVDSSLLGDSTGSGFAVYQLVDEAGAVWKWIPSEVAGDWVSFTVQDTSLGTYILARNNQLPVMTPLGHGQPVEGQVLRLFYRGTSNIQNPRLSLVFRKGGSLPLTLPLVPQPGDTQWVDIPGKDVSLNGLVYRFEITDGSNLVQAEYQEVNIVNTGDLAIPLILQQGVYQAFSLPMNHPNSNVQNLLMDEWGDEDRKIWRLFRYNTQFIELTKESEITTGESYWYKMQDQVPTITLEAGTSESVPLITGTNLTLHAGWNTFSNPYMFSLTLDDLQADNGGSNLIIYSYLQENIYYAITSDSTIDPWKGYIIWNGSAGSELLQNLKVTGIPPDSGALKKSGKTQGTRIKLFLKGRSSANGELTLAYNMPGALPGPDKWDLPKPATPASAVSLDLEVPGSRTHYLTDTRGDVGKGQTYKFNTRSQFENEILTLTVSGADRAQPPHRVVLLNDSNGDFMELTDAGSENYKFKASAAQRDRFELLVGTDEYIQDRLNSFHDVIRQTKLKQNFPNPFISTTTIHYHVPGSRSLPQRVRLDVYNLQGQVVRTLVNAPMEGGRHRAEWNGRNSSGLIMPAGTYIYRLRVGEDVVQKKLVLLR